MELSEITKFLKRVQAIAKVGLSYSEGPYDLERYQELQSLTHDLLSNLTGFDKQQIQMQFAKMDRYPTPKIDVRALIMKEDKVLLIQEKSDEKWSLPGGWCEIGLTPTENIVKEVREEAGIEVEVERLLSVWDKKCHEHPPEINYVYKLSFLCQQISGVVKPGHEALEAAYFHLEDLPPLSLLRNTEAQIRNLVGLANSRSAPTSFD